MPYLLDLARQQNLKGPNGEYAWYWVEDNSGSPRYTRGGLPPDAPEPKSSTVWPLLRKRPIKVYRFVSGKGPNGARCIGYRRGNGARGHAGIDLCAKYGDVVVSVADGTIVNFYWFYKGVFALFIDHGDYVVNYGEIDRSSLSRFNLKTPSFADGNKLRRTTRFYTGTDLDSVGDSYPWLASEGSSVKAGDPIGVVGKMEKSSMLHFEMYSSGVTRNKRWTGFPDSSPPSGLLNPTNFLLTLSGRKREAQPSAKEETITSVCR